MTPEAMEVIAKEITDSDFQKLARQQGMTSMQEDGLIKILLGFTSFEEVERATGPLMLE